MSISFNDLFFVLFFTRVHTKTNCFCIVFAIFQDNWTMETKVKIWKLLADNFSEKCEKYNSVNSPSYSVTTLQKTNNTLWKSTIVGNNCAYDILRHRIKTDKIFNQKSLSKMIQFENFKKLNYAWTPLRGSGRTSSLSGSTQLPLPIGSPLGVKFIIFDWKIRLCPGTGAFEKPHLN